MEPSQAERLTELQEKLGQARTDRNKSLDLSKVDRPDPVQLRIKSRRCLGVKGPTKLVHVDWSADRQRVAVCCKDGFVVCWNAFTGAPVNHATFKMSTPWALCCAFSANGQDIAAAGRDNTCKIFSLSSGTSHVVAQHSDFISSCLFAGSQQELLTGSGDTLCGLWDIEGAKLITSFQGHTAEVMSLSMAPLPIMSSVFLSASHDCSVRVWDTRTHKMVQCFGGLPSGAICVSIAGSGDTFAVGCEESSVHLCDLRADAELARLDDKSMLFPCNSLSFSFSNRMLFGACNDFSVNVWDTLRCERIGQLFGHDDRVSCVRTCPDSSCIATTSYDGNIRIWA